MIKDIFLPKRMGSKKERYFYKLKEEEVKRKEAEDNAARFNKEYQDAYNGKPLEVKREPCEIDKITFKEFTLMLEERARSIDFYQRANNDTGEFENFDTKERYKLAGIRMAVMKLRNIFSAIKLPDGKTGYEQLIEEIIRLECQLEEWHNSIFIRAIENLKTNFYNASNGSVNFNEED